MSWYLYVSLLLKELTYQSGVAHFDSTPRKLFHPGPRSLLDIGCSMIQLAYSLVTLLSRPSRLRFSELFCDRFNYGI